MRTLSSKLIETTARSGHWSGRCRSQPDFVKSVTMSVGASQAAARICRSAFVPFCCPAYRDRAQQQYVEVVYDGPGNVRVLVQDWDEEGKEGDMRNRAAGSPRNHVETMLRQAVNAKKDRNLLSENRPNVLAVNLLLTDSAGAHSLRPNAIHETAPDLSDTGIDVLAGSWETGIDTHQARLVTASARTAELREAVTWLVK